jgi:Bpu10I restriction endonuclease
MSLDGPDELLEPVPTPHFDKLRELRANEKLPEHDQQRIESAIDRYRQWISAMDELEVEGPERIASLVESVNQYKRFIELELIWDSEADFLFRQRGQLKLDNSIIEEFLPRLIDPRVIPSLAGKSYVTGPRRTFAGAYFVTSLPSGAETPGLGIRGKDQDFTVSRPAYLRASFDPSFETEDPPKTMYLAYVAAECKTNLDKTMFQEAVATASQALNTAGRSRTS